MSACRQFIRAIIESRSGCLKGTIPIRIVKLAPIQPAGRAIIRNNERNRDVPSKDGKC
jgi:hypothetical protein